MGGICLYGDIEHKLDRKYVSRIVPNPDDLIIIRPPYVERGIVSIKRFFTHLESHRHEHGIVPAIVVVDSVTAWPSKKEYLADDEDYTIAGQAAALSTGLRSLTRHVWDQHVLFLWISQIRENIGVVFGKSTKYTSGRALPFYATVVANVKCVGQVKKGSKVIGIDTELYVEKNQVAPPFKKAKQRIVFGGGYDRMDGLIQAAIDAGIVDYSGGYVRFDDHPKFGSMKARRAELGKKLGKDGRALLKREVIKHARGRSK